MNAEASTPAPPVPAKIAESVDRGTSAARIVNASAREPRVPALRIVVPIPAAIPRRLGRDARHHLRPVRGREHSLADPEEHHRAAEERVRAVRGEPEQDEEPEGTDEETDGPEGAGPPTVGDPPAQRTGGDERRRQGEQEDSGGEGRIAEDPLEVEHHHERERAPGEGRQSRGDVADEERPDPEEGEVEHRVLGRSAP